MKSTCAEYPPLEGVGGGLTRADNADVLFSPEGVGYLSAYAEALEFVLIHFN